MGFWRAWLVLGPAGKTARPGPGPGARAARSQEAAPKNGDRRAAERGDETAIRNLKKRGIKV